MTRAASRYSLLALAIAATIPAHALPVAIDYTCTPSSGNSTACYLYDETYNTVNIESGTTLEGTVFGVHVEEASVSTLNNNGSVTGSATAGLYNIDSSIGTLLNTGSISGNNHGVANDGEITTLINKGNISGATTGLKNYNLDASIGTLDNRGSISGDTFGLVNDGALIGVLTNSGTISGSQGIANSGTINKLNNRNIISGTSYGVNNTNGTITEFNNSGTISGGSIGLMIWGGNVTTLNNSGTIAGNDAIDVNIGTPMTINNSGNILGRSASSYAINAQNAGDNVTLNWSGGLIRGGMRGVNAISITGDVVYDTRYSYGSIEVAGGASLTFEQDQVSHFGSLTVAANGSLDLYLSSATPLKSDNPSFAIVSQIDTASFASGSEVGLKVRGSDFAADQSTYTLLAGEGIINNGLSVVTRNSALLQVDDYWTENNRLYATVTTLDSYEFAGNTPNGQRAGSAILPMLSGLASHFGNDPVLDALAGDSEQVRRTVEELVPQVNGGVLHAANNLHHQAALNAGQRTQGLRGASAGDTFAESGLWLKVLESDADQDERDNVEGFNADTSGLAIGVDGKLNDQLTLGLAYSYQNTDISSDSGNQTDIDGHAISLYSGYEQGAWFVDSSLTLGLNHNDSERHIAGTTAKADYDSKLLGLNVLAGYGLQLDNGLLLEPRAAARYGRIDIDGFREKGSVAALQVSSQRFEIAELGAGLRLAGSTALGNGTLEPEARVMAYHDFAADRIDTTANFVFGGSSFAATGASPARTRYEAGVGVDYKLDALTLGLSYDYTSKEDFNADTFQAKVRYDF